VPTFWCISVELCLQGMCVLPNFMSLSSAYIRPYNSFFFFLKDIRKVLIMYHILHRTALNDISDLFLMCGCLFC
jgi:hypothetical protein